MEKSLFGFIKNAAFVACAVFLLTCCIVCGETETACFGKASEADIVSIEEEKMPLAAPATTIEENKAAFENGDSVRTDNIDEGSVTINTNLAGQGIVGICTDVASDKKLKIKVSKDGSIVYYDIVPGEMMKVPMQFGNGTYTIELYRNLQESEYVQLYTGNVDIAMADENKVFLNANKVVNYENSAIAPKLVAELTAGSDSDADKLSAIYDYVVGHISYNRNKIDTLDSSYIPNIDEILGSGNGICYDFAAVMASLLREAGIPAKLAMGYRKDTQAYHAWNEVLVDGAWMTVDATWDSVSREAGQPTELVKDAALYSVEKVF